MAIAAPTIAERADSLRADAKGDGIAGERRLTLRLNQYLRANGKIRRATGFGIVRIGDSHGISCCVRKLRVADAEGRAVDVWNGGAVGQPLVGEKAISNRDRIQVCLTIGVHGGRSR